MSQPNSPTRNALALSLAANGQWRTLLEKIQSPPPGRTTKLEADPRDGIIRAISLLKLRMYGQALKELEVVSDMLSDDNFSLRALRLVIEAEVYQLQGYPHAEKGIKFLFKALALSQSKKLEMDVYILTTIAQAYVRMSEYTTALKIFQKLYVEYQSSKALALSAILFLHIGAVNAAEEILFEMDKIEEANREFNRHRTIVRGLVLFGKKKYVEAAKEFHTIVQENPSDSVAANNWAICHMYNRDLTQALTYMQEKQSESNHHFLNEACVLNLSSLYDLACTDPVSKKRTLKNWVAREAPDCFTHSM